MDSEVEQNGLELAQLTAVRTLLSSKSLAEDCDILMTTALEALYSEALTEPAIRAFVNRVWPGTNVNDTSLAPAIAIAKKARLIEAETGEPGQTIWHLTSRARADVEEARSWARGIFDETVHQVLRELRKADYRVGLREAELWTKKLQQALLAGSRGNLAVFDGVVQQSGELLAPAGFDWRRIRVIEHSTQTEEDEKTLHNLVRLALNPTKTFANELVSDITVGYLLQAVVGNRTYRPAREAASLAKDYAILDTPVLLQLLGPLTQATRIENVIRAAWQAEMNVVVPDQYLDELCYLVSSVYDQFADQIEQAQKMDAEIALVMDSPVARIWLRAKKEGRYRDWTGFSEAARNMASTLKPLGVKIQNRTTQPDGPVQACLAALKEETGLDRRPEMVFQRDAEVMAFAHGLRPRATSDKEAWPGAWVITSDEHMSPAYRKVYPDEKFGLAISPAAWAAIVSRCSPPAPRKQLAKAAGDMLTEQSFLSIAGQWSIKDALRIVTKLKAKDTSDLDIQGVYSVDEMIAKQPNFDAEKDEAADRVVDQVLSERRSRQIATQAERLERMRQREDAVGERERAQRQRERDVDEEIENLRSELRQVKEDNKGKDNRLVLFKRRSILTGLVLPFFVLAVLAAYIQFWVGLVIAVVGGAAVVALSLDWANDITKSSKRQVVATAVGLVLAFTSIIVRLVVH
jgi:hypothetical protein